MHRRRVDLLTPDDISRHHAFLIQWKLGDDWADTAARALKRQRPDARVLVAIPLSGPFDLHLDDIDGLIDPADDGDAVLDALTAA